MHIRIATPGDLGQINTIYNQAIEEKLTADTVPLSMAERVKWLEAHDSRTYPVFVCEINNQVVAWLSFSKYRAGRKALQKTAEISYYINRSYRQRGIGTALIQFAMQQTAHYHFKNLLAIVLEWNTGSVRLLQKCGFEQWGYLPGVADLDGAICGHLYFGINL